MHVREPFSAISLTALQKDSHLHSIHQGRRGPWHLSKVYKITTSTTNSYCQGRMSYLGLSFLKVIIKL